MFNWLPKINDIFSMTVVAVLLIVCAVIAVLGYRVLKYIFGPGILRGLIALVLVGGLVVNIYSILRAASGVGIGTDIAAFLLTPLGSIYKISFEAFTGDSLPVDSSISSYLLFFALGGAYGWLWGVGSFDPSLSVEHVEEPATEAPIAAVGVADAPISRVPPSVVRTISSLITVSRQVIPVVVNFIKPLVRPLLVALSITVIGLAILMVVSFFGPHDVQTVNPDASAVTPAGIIYTPFTNADGSPVTMSKTVFFVVLVVVVLGALASLAVLLAVLVNWLSQEVKEAKAMPDQPEATEPLLLRLIDFFVSWAGDILSVFGQSVQR